MKKLLLLSLPTWCFVVSSTFGQDVCNNFDKDTDFAKVKTYKWVPINDAAPVDALTDRQIKSAMDAEVANKGLTKVNGDNAALLVGYQTAIGTEK